VPDQPHWTILEYTTDTGVSPVRDFLEGLAGRNQEEALALLGRLREAGPTLRRPTSGALGEGLFELRGHEVRLFYMFLPGRRAVLLDGIVKKQQAIPPVVLRRVRRYQRAVRALQGSGA
jgi:hypothetical protein